MDVGGRLAYSTCALDPLQNEAVIHAALKGRRDLRLVPPEEALPPAAAEAVRAHGGLRSWRVPHPAFDSDEAGVVGGRDVLFPQWADVTEELRGDDEDDADGEAAGRQSGSEWPSLYSSMFPPSDEDGARSLDAVIRLLPTHSTTADHGGFFVALIERVAVVEEEAEEDGDAARSGLAPHSLPSERAGVQEASSAPTPSAAASAPRGTSPHSWMPAPDVLAELASFFGLGHAASGALLSNLVVTARGACAAREGERPSDVGGEEAANEELLLAATSAKAGELLATLPTSRTDSSGGTTRAEAPLCVIGAGLPVFARMPVQCDWWPRAARWRVCQEGAALLASLRLGRRHVKLCTAAAALELLTARQLPCERLQALGAEGALLGLETCSRPGDNSALEAGAVVLSLPSLRCTTSAGVGMQSLAVPAVLLSTLDTGSGGASSVPPPVHPPPASHAATSMLLLAADDVVRRYVQMMAD